MNIRKGKSICFFSSKGGVGKTVNILNLAGIFEQLEKRVLIVDMDLYTGSIATYINKEVKTCIYDLSEDILNNRCTNIKDYETTYDEYISILACPIDPRDASKIDPRTITEIIKKAELEYDVVLIDTNHALNDINLVTLSSVDDIIFFTTNDPMDLKSMKSLISIMKELEYTNYKVLLNNSRDPFKSYFKLYDIKHILNNNIDYTLSVDLFIKDMEKCIMNSMIMTLNKKFSSTMPKDYKTFLTIATDLLGDKKDE